MWIDDLKNIIDPDSILSANEDIQLHSYDAWPLAAKWRKQGKQPYRPDVVVRATSAEQISRLLHWASEQHIPVTPWGAGSSVTGAPLPVRGGVALDLTAMNRITALDEINLLVSVQAGIMGGDLENALNARGYTLGHSPQSLYRSTVGGWIATRASGQFSSSRGSIEDLLLGFTVALPNGELIDIRSMPRAAVGPDLRHLFVGAEGTLGVITEATLKIFPVADHRRFEAVAFGSVDAGIEVMRRVTRAGLRPFLARYYDEDESRHVMKDSKFDGCAMFLGFEGLEAITEVEYSVVMDICRAAGGTLLGSAPVEAWMERRFDFSTVENLLATTGGYAETIEIAQFWDKIPATYRALKAALTPQADEVLGHFSHIYSQGSSLYLILLGQLNEDAEAEARILQIWETAMQVCLTRGAAISHHHGIGLARNPYIRADLGSSFRLLERVKAAFDPAGIMNPGKLGLE